jgi:membrane fusion protein (multidrug efflux system)
LVAGSNEIFSAKVYAIEPEVEVATTRTLQVQSIADNKKRNFITRYFADVELPLDIIKDAIVVVPTEAVIPVQKERKYLLQVTVKPKKL